MEVFNLWRWLTLMYCTYYMNHIYEPSDEVVRLMYAVAYKVFLELVVLEIEQHLILKVLHAKGMTGCSSI